MASKALIKKNEVVPQQDTAEELDAELLERDSIANRILRQIDPQIDLLGVLGMIAGSCDFMEFRQVINEAVGKNSHLAKVEVSDCAEALILQLVCAPYQSLYRTAEFFQNTPIAQLLGKDIEAADLNRYVLARALDAIYKAGPKELFIKCAAQAVRKLGLTVEEVHIDSTSFHYDGQVKEDDLAELKITHGYSRDHRPDLPQIVLLGLVDGNSGLPVYTSSLSGNEQDKKSFREAITKDFPSLLKELKDLKYLVGDSALCTKESISETRKLGLHIVTRVPDNTAIAKRCFEMGENADLQPFEDFEFSGAKGLWCGTDELNGVKVKLLLVDNESMKPLKRDTLNRRAAREQEKLQVKLNKLATNPAACRADAEKNLEKLIKTCRLCAVENIRFEEVKKHTGRGRPKAGAEQKTVAVKVIAEAVISSEAVERQLTQEVRYVLATTDTERCWKMSDLSAIYKRQSRVEGLWKLSKDPGIMLNAIFLKKPERIQALMWVMSMALLVYAVTEVRMRQAAQQAGISEVDLVEENKKGSTRKQKKLPAGKSKLPAKADSQAKPQPKQVLTLRRFKQYTDNCHISVMTIGEYVAITGLTEPFRQIISLMGPEWSRFYLNETYMAEGSAKALENKAM